MSARNLILSGGIFHPFDESSRALAQALGSVGVDSEVCEDIESGLAALAEGGRYELLTVNALRWRMAGEKYDPYREEWFFDLSDAGAKAITAHVHGGGGLLGIHTASICFDAWDDWRALLGGAWSWGTSHHPDKGAVSVRVRSERHAIVSGLDDFEVDDEIYHDLTLAPDVTALLTADSGEGAQPLLWARSVGSGRVVYDALGHDAASLNQPVHRRILRRAARWLLGDGDDAVKGVT